jgi:LAO/AO transport system kinase
MKDLAQDVLNGDARSIARLITLAENDTSEAIQALKILHKFSGQAHVIGVTGVMGSGKSSLIFQLAHSYRKQGKTVGVIAIDPTSPFSGGALLGDRIRMMELSSDDGVFIRSMGTRGMLGGIASSVYDVVDILDAAGFDIILVETVGVGQDQVDVIKIADSTLVVLVPGLGDSIQTIKAGLMEIADIFVVNKADRPGVEQLIAEIEAFLDISSDLKRPTPIVPTSIKNNQGISQLLEQIDDHFRYLEKKNLLEPRRRKRYEAELIELIRKRLMSFIFDESNLESHIETLIDQISRKKLDPYSAAEQVLNRVLK